LSELPFALSSSKCNWRREEWFDRLTTNGISVIAWSRRRRGNGGSFLSPSSSPKTRHPELYTRHPELVSGSSVSSSTPASLPLWMLKQVQHDEERDYPSSTQTSRSFSKVSGRSVPRTDLKLGWGGFSRRSNVLFIKASPPLQFAPLLPAAVHPELVDPKVERSSATLHADRCTSTGSVRTAGGKLFHPHIQAQASERTFSIRAR